MNMLDISGVTLAREYANNGQHKEQKAVLALTGKVKKADNKPYTEGGDVLDIQIKSARATVCKGTNLIEHLKHDGATRYAYITKDDKMYIMSRKEYIEFVEEFGTITTESAKNGGHEKIRLGHETKKMLEWLAERA